MILGEIDDITKELVVKFISLDVREYEEIEIDISDTHSNEEIIETINEMYLPNDKYFKIILIGHKKIEIETQKILKHITNQNIIKIKDETELELNLEEIAKQRNLKGIFVKELLKRMEQEPENGEKIEKAIEIGLSLF